MQFPELAGGFRLALELKTRNAADASHEALVAMVLQRAAELALPPGKDLPVRVEGSRPTIITFHPTGRSFAMFPDYATYQSAVARHEVNPREPISDAFQERCLAGRTTSSEPGLMNIRDSPKGPSVPGCVTRSAATSRGASDT